MGIHPYGNIRFFDHGAEVKKVSPFSGSVNTLFIPGLTIQDVRAWKKEGKLIQDAMPHIKSEHREFLMSGITPAEWNATFSE